MYTLGRGFVAPDIHAGGLRYHGTSEFLSAMHHNKLITAKAVSQVDSLQAGLIFFESEGILPSPESAYAISVGIREAKMHPKDKDPSIILINISGHGYFDLSAYSLYRKGMIDDAMPDEKKLKASLDSLMELS
ncbi:MAG: hypothetical protein K2P98_02420 [Neisseriaceae bacterium]|nr:hypothetical protein [Neisseriaceae bacterium]